MIDIKVDISNGALNELRYLHGGGSSINPMYAPELIDIGAIHKKLELHIGSGVSSGCMYPYATMTKFGKAIVKGTS